MNIIVLAYFVMCVRETLIDSPTKDEAGGCIKNNYRVLSFSFFIPQRSVREFVYVSKRSYVYATHTRRCANVHVVKYYAVMHVLICTLCN